MGLSLLNDVVLEALALGEANKSVVGLADDKHVAETGGELVATGVSDVDDLERTSVLLATDDDAHATDVAPAGDHDCVADLKLDKVDNLAGGEVDLDGVVGADRGVGVADGARVVGREEGDALTADLDLGHTAQLEGGLLGSDGVDRETALDVVEETEVLAGLVDGDDIHEAGREVRVGADLAVDLDKTLHHNVGNLTAGERVFQAVAEEQHQRKALTELVRTSRRTGRIGTAKLVKHPVLGRCKSLKVMFGTTSLKKIPKM